MIAVGVDTHHGETATNVNLNLINHFLIFV